MPHDLNSLADPSAERRYISDDEPIDPTLVESLTGLKPPTPPSTRCASSRILLILTGGRYIFCSPPCKSWKCKMCRPGLQWSWGVHFVRLLLNLRCRLYVDSIPATEWASACRSVTRARKGKRRGAYLRIGDLVLSTQPAKKKNAATVDHVLALRMIGEALREAGAKPTTGRRCQPVSTSRKWSLPKPEQAREKSVGVAVIPAKVSADLIRRELEDRGIVGRFRPRGGSWSITLDGDTDVIRLTHAVDAIRRKAS